MDGANGAVRPVRSGAAAGGLLSQLRGLVSALRLAESRGGRGGGFAACNVSALSTQLDDAAAELDALREASAVESAAARAAAAEATAALRLSQERVARRDTDAKTLHAKLKDARAQLVRASAGRRRSCASAALRLAWATRCGCARARACSAPPAPRSCALTARLPAQAASEAALVEKDAALQGAAAAIRQADAAAALRTAELTSLREQAKTAATTFRRQMEAQMEGAPSRPAFGSAGCAA